MDTLVSILIPVYNREHLVGETIESAINQTYKNIEIIIVDNCSTDNTWQVLEHYAALDNRIRLFKNKENIGPVRNWKRCIDEAKGEYAKILFSDDLISENFIEETLKYFDKNTAFVLSKIKVVDKEKIFKISKYDNRKNITIKEYFNNILLFNNLRFPISPGAALFRAKDLKNSMEVDIPNPINLDFKNYGAGNDLLLFLNTAINYSEIKTIEDTTAFFRLHNQSFTIENQLNTFYEYTRLYFIKNYQPQLLPKFKTVLWFRKKLKLTDEKVYNLIVGEIAGFYLVRQLFIEIFKKIKL